MPYSKDIRFAEDTCDLPDYLDARDISKRLAELEEEKRECEAAANDPEHDENDAGEKAAPSTAPPTDQPEWSEDKESLLVALREMVDEGCESWVSDNEWVNYCRELAHDCGMLERDSSLDNYVDWEKWAEDCAQDYTQVQAGATVYYGQ